MTIAGTGPAAGAVRAGAEAPPPRLVKAAHEFEAQMMRELMAPLAHGASGIDASAQDGDESGSAGALGEFAAEALGQALSAAGGFGIAHRILDRIGHADGGKVAPDGLRLHRG